MRAAGAAQTLFEMIDELTNTGQEPLCWQDHFCADKPKLGKKKPRASFAARGLKCDMC
jgi:hypothetical protein